MRGLPSILFLFRNEFNKFNYSGARLLDSIYHMTSNLLKNHDFGSHFRRDDVKNFAIIYATL